MSKKSINYPHRISISLNDRQKEKLERYSQKRGHSSQAETVRRAIEMLPMPIDLHPAEPPRELPRCRCRIEPIDPSTVEELNKTQNFVDRVFKFIRRLLP